MQRHFSSIYLLGIISPVNKPRSMHFRSICWRKIEMCCLSGCCGFLAWLYVTCARTHTHTQPHTHTQTHTHTQSIDPLVFVLCEWL